MNKKHFNTSFVDKEVMFSSVLVGWLVGWLATGRSVGGLVHSFLRSFLCTLVHTAGLFAC